MKIKTSNANMPEWHNVSVKPNIPEALNKLEEISRNIWWVWNARAKSLFKSIDPALWTETHHNPVLMLEHLSYEKLQEMTKNRKLIDDEFRL